MREITAIIRRTRLKETLQALEDIGVVSTTVHSVNGRGKQGGSIMENVDPEMPKDIEYVSKIYTSPTPSSMAGDSTLTKPVFWVPKNLLEIVISDVPVKKVVDTIMRINRSGKHGDGKIFVLPIQDSMRIRTDERGNAAII
jgi:nitrogen regulatory protein PII 2